MANDIEVAPESAVANQARPRPVPEETVKYLQALGGSFVCAASVSLTTDEDGEHGFDFKLLPEFLSVRQAASALAVSPHTVRKLMRDGILAEHRIGNAVVVGWMSVWDILKVSQ